MMGPDGKIVLYRFVEDSGATFAMQINMEPGFDSIVKSCWYMNANFKKVYVNHEDLVTVYIDYARGGAPEVQLMATRKNPKVLTYSAHLKFRDRPIRVRGYYLVGHEKWAERRARTTLAAQVGASFNVLNGFIKSNPQEFKFNC